MKRWTISLVMFLSAGISLYCGGSPENLEKDGDHGEDTVSVTDCLGRTVKVQIPVERVAFTHYASAEALKVLGAWDKVVGRDGYTHDELIFPGIDSLPAVTEMMEGPYTPNLEALLDLNPDLLILEVIPMPGIEELLADLEGIIPVVTVKTYDPGEMFHSFEILGQLLGKEKEAEDFSFWVKSVQSAILEKTGALKEEDKTSMFYKTGYGSVEDLMTFSNDMSYVPARNRFSGAVNIAADLPSQGGWVPSIDPEWVAQQDFDVLIIGDPLIDGYGPLVDDTGRLAEYRERVMELPYFVGSAAVMNNRVYMLADEFFGTSRHIIGFSYLAKWFHPDLFAQMDPAELHQEYFDRFLKVDADVINHGQFVYPRE